MSFEEKYLNTHVFYDEKTNFTLNFAGFAPLTNLKVFKDYKYSIEAALEKFKEIEQGKVVNKTSVKEESENRSVDHYNLRLKEELVKGKSLQHSIDYWKQIKQYVSEILQGKITNKNKKPYTDVIFNGIGGSYLGPLMMLVAIKGNDFNFNTGLKLRMHFVCNTDSDSFSSTMKKLDLETAIMVNMSKSGSTSETKGNMDAFNDLLVSKGLDIGHHNIAVTTPGSNFDKYAKENKFLNIFYMNNETGGRVSVVSAIGMIPCAFAELDFEEFLQGLSYMDQLCRRSNPLENPAMILAIGIDKLTNTQGRKNMIVLGYSDFLKEFSHYLQQLYMESLGKEYNEKGFQNPEGQTVFGGVGTGEQHAFMQQIQKGISDAFVRFVYFLKRKEDFTLKDKGSMGRQLLAFVKGTEEALLKNERPFISSTFEKCDLFNLGMMISMEENIVSIIASFRDINAYDQPGVQDGKLAADKMNHVSKQIEKKVSEINDWKGDAEEAKKAFDLKDAPILFIDSILSDLSANGELKSYQVGNKKVKRSFEKGRFVYTISSSL